MKKGCSHSRVFIFDWTFILSGSEDTHKISEKFDLGTMTKLFPIAYHWEKDEVTRASTLIFDWIFFILPESDDNHYIFDDFDLRPDRNFHFRISREVNNVTAIPQ